MAKEVREFQWPTPFDGAGKNFRILFEEAAKHAGDNRGSSGGSYPHLREKLRDFEERFGKSETLDAGAIAFAYLGYLVENKVIPPLEDGMYI